MVPMPVTLNYHTLFCFHGADESDSEPYMWVIGITLDGRTITHQPDATRLTGGPSFFFSPGSHGSIGGPMGIGTERQLPPAVSRFDTTLQPIVLQVAGQTLEVPGAVGMLTILLEEDNTSDEGADAAHDAINQLVKIELEEAVADIDLGGLAVQVGQAMAAGTDPVATVKAALQEKKDRVVERIRRYARSTAVDAIVSKLSFPAAIVEGADPDNLMGISVQWFDADDLASTRDDQRLPLDDTISDGSPFLESSDYVYNLHGQAWQRIRVTTTPITDQVPAGRWQVTGLNRQGRPGRQFISHLGGKFADGSPWLLTKGQVMDLLAAGTHTFFVHGDSGVDADIIIQPDPFNPLFPSVTTTADNDPSNNLGVLPQCPLVNVHEEPV